MREKAGIEDIWKRFERIWRVKSEAEHKA